MKLQLKQILLSKDTLTFLLFLVLSSVIWFGHALTSMRNARVPVKLVYTGVPDNVTLSDSTPRQLTIVVRDAGSRLHKYYSHPMTLEIDLENQIIHREGTIRVSSEAIRQSLTNQMPGTSKLQQVTPEHIEGHYYREQEKTVPLILQCRATAKKQCELLYEPICEQKTIRIFGQRSALDTVNAIYTEAVEIVDVEDTVRQQVRLLLPENVRSVEEYVTVEVAAARFTEKRFHMVVQPYDVPEDCTLRLFPNEVEVNLQVWMSHFGEINPGDVHVFCRMPKHGAKTATVEVKYTNPYIMSARVKPSVLEFIIEHEKNTDVRLADAISQN